MTKKVADKISKFVKDKVPFACDYEYSKETGSMQIILFKASDEFNGRDDAAYVARKCADIVAKINETFNVSASITKTREQGFMNIVKLKAK